MRPLLTSLRQSEAGTAAAEMALVTPLLMVLIFGAFELGNYFYSEHVVVKAVRDGARYASRRSFVDFPSCTPSTDVITKTRNVTMTGQTGSGGATRLAGWTNVATISVTGECVTSGAYVNKGIYTGATSLTPRVTVSAAVPYVPILNSLGLASAGSLTLNARSQASVMGI